MKAKRKALVLVICAVLLTCSAVSGTLAYMFDRETKLNTFAIGRIGIDLSETTGFSYKMTPGSALRKDPTVTVASGSEACWLFVELEESNNFGTFLAYAVAGGWTYLDGGVYYRQVSAADAEAGVIYSVLEGDKVTVKTTVTDKDLVSLREGTFPTLDITAYAIQCDSNVAEASQAWAYLKSEFAGN